jgi:hypothetical protein
VGHVQWVFTIPKMLRIYFLHHRQLLGALSRAAYETVKELMVSAVEEKGRLQRLRGRDHREHVDQGASTRLPDPPGGRPAARA